MAVRAGTLIDGTGKPPVNDGVVVIEGSHVKEVGNAAKVEIPQGAKVIDASEETVIPGLIDSHVHLHGDIPSPYVLWHLHGKLGANTMLGLASSAWIGIVNACNGREWLERGFTTVRDLGFSLEASVALKKAQEMRLLTSTRIVSGGYVFGTGSHLCSVFPPSMILQRPEMGVADGVDEIRKRVRQLCFLEADVIKTCSASGASTGDFKWRNYTLEEMTALCDESQAWGRIVACHSHAAHGISKIVHAGATANATVTVEHGTFLKDCDLETIRLMKEKRVNWITTVGESQRSGRAESVRKMTEQHRQNTILADCAREDSFRLALKEGIKITFGTDSYPDPFPERSYPGKGEKIPTHRLEFETYVKWGMKPLDAIKAATLSSAEACGISTKTGSIENGKLADILVVRGNPLNDIGILGEKSNLRIIIQGGQIVAQRSSLTS
jgi:imidazolonepropionase-like amidohydrolase